MISLNELMKETLI